MSIAAGIRTHLINDGTLQSLLEATRGFRKVHFVHKPKSVTYPAIVVTGTDAERPSEKVLVSDPVNGNLVFGTFDFDCKAKSWSLADKIREQLRKRLKKSSNGGVWGTEVIDGLRISNSEDDVEPATDGSENDVYVANLEAEITYREAVS